MASPAFVALQLSDLHRSAADPVGNAELIGRSRVGPSRLRTRIAASSASFFTGKQEDGVATAALSERAEAQR
jgi:hypothetical protein